MTPVFAIVILLAGLAFVAETAGYGFGRVWKLAAARRARTECDRLQRQTDQLRREIVEINARADRAEQQAQVLCAASAGPSFGPTAMLLLSSGESHTGLLSIDLSTEAPTMMTPEQFAAAFNIPHDTDDETMLATAIDAYSRLRIEHDQLKLEAMCLRQERDIATAARERSESDLAAILADDGARVRVEVEQATLATNVDSAIERAYRDGKLLRTRDDDGNILPSAREARLRTLAARDGFAALVEEIAEYPQLALVNQRIVDGNDRKAPRISGALVSAAEQLDLDVDALARHADEHPRGSK